MEKKSGFPVGRAILCGVIALLMIVANGAKMPRSSSIATIWKAFTLAIATMKPAD